MNFSGIVCEPIKLDKQVLTVFHVRDSQIVKPSCNVNGRLVSDNMADLMPEQRGQFFLILSECNQSPEDINPPTGRSKRVQLGRIDEGKPVMQPGGRELGQ